MRLRSCFLYTVAFLLVAVVCVAIAVTTVARGQRAASLERLNATLAARGFSIGEAGAPNAPAPLPPEVAPGDTPADEEDAESVLRAFADLMARVKERQQGEHWRPMLDLIGGEDPRSWSEAQWGQLRDFLDANQDLIEAVRLLAAKGQPLVRLPWPFNPEASQEHLSVARELARLLAVDALLGGHDGDYDRTAVDIEACLGFADAIARDGWVTSGLFSFAIVGIAHVALRDAVAPGALTAAESAALVEAMGGAYGRDTLAICLAREATVGQQALEEHRARNVFLRPMWDIDQAAHAEMMDTLIAAADRPYYEVLPELEAMEAQLEGGLPFLRVITRVSVPALTRTLQAQARRVATVDLMRMGLLLERQYADNGQYPDSLDAIAPDLGGTVPVDPFTGEPYRYLPSGDTFRLYSVGPNGADDGGMHDARRGDIVWRGREAE